MTVPGPAHYFAEGSIHHNSCKTFNVVSFACLWWALAPTISSVIIVSTSLKSLRRRGWAEVQRFYTLNDWTRSTGHFVDSMMNWQATQGDAKQAIVGIAVEQGSITQVADNIKGVHTRRQMVIIDEATAVPDAIWDACNNLYSYPDEFLIAALANPRDRYGRFGRFIEPKDGWTSVDVDTEEWDGKPQPDLGGKPVRVVRFDAEKSPNIVEGKIVSSHLPTEAKVRAARNHSGGGKTPLYWTNFRGFPPPEGMSKTVFTESALAKAKASERFQFTGRHFRIIGMFDPAFGGGDRPVLRLAKMGEVGEIGGRLAIESLPPVEIPLNAESSNPIHFQLAEGLRRLCERFEHDGQNYSCSPENLAIDATGEGGGLCDIVARTWSPSVIRVEFGGKASEDSVNLEDIRRACEVYENKSAEMHFRTRDALNSGQLRGIDSATAAELVRREFDDSGKRIKLQKKVDYKARFGESPDYGDSLVGLLEVARLRGFRLAPIGETEKRIEQDDEFYQRANSVYDSADIGAEEELSEA